MSQTRTPPLAPEAVIIRRVLAGETDLFRDLLQGHLPFLQAYASRALGNPADAEDAVQEAVIKAFVHLPEFRLESRFLTWLFRILCNEIGRIRRARRAACVLSVQDDVMELCESQKPLWPNRNLSALDSLVLKENAERLYQFLGRIPGSFRTVMVLREIEGLSTGETARHLSLTTTTVKTRLFRARRHLAKLYSVPERPPRPVSGTDPRKRAFVRADGSGGRHDAKHHCSLTGE